MILQRIVLILGCVLIAIIVMFPPYFGTYVRDGDNLTRFIGYYPIIKPPAPSVVATKMELESGAYAPQRRYHSQIDVDRLYAQIVGVVLLVVGLVLALRPKPSMKTASDVRWSERPS